MRRSRNPRETMVAMVAQARHFVHLFLVISSEPGASIRPAELLREPSGTGRSLGGIRGRTRTCGLRFRKAGIGSAAKAWFLGFQGSRESTGYRLGYRAAARWRDCTRAVETETWASWTVSDPGPPFQCHSLASRRVR